MAYIYKNLKTNKVVTKEEPIRGANKRDYQLMSWVKNAQMDSSEIKTKKVSKKKESNKKEEVKKTK